MQTHLVVVVADPRRLEGCLNRLARRQAGSRLRLPSPGLQTSGVEVAWSRMQRTNCCPKRPIRLSASGGLSGNLTLRKSPVPRGRIVLDDPESMSAFHCVVYDPADDHGRPQYRFAGIYESFFLASWEGVTGLVHPTPTMYDSAAGRTYSITVRARRRWSML